MRSFTTVNPFTETVIAEYRYYSTDELNNILQLSSTAFDSWKIKTVVQRSAFIKKLAIVLREKNESLAQLMTAEMGKPISQSYAEVEKCAVLCEYYATNADDFLKPESIQSDASRSYISYDALGTVLGIMPWNFPLWQVLRFAVPATIAGNCAILKHSPNVTGTALEIEKLFIESGFPANVFRSIVAHTDDIPAIVASDVIASISVTASEQTGSIMGELAGKNIKKSVLELGGSDAFIVMADADIEKAVSIATASRLFNSGQTCISAKRFIVHESIFDAFVDKLKSAFQSQKVGDPTDPETTIGPLARKDLVDTLHKQVQKSVEMGDERIVCKTNVPSKGYFYNPEILLTAALNTPAFCEETFGPVAAVCKYSSDEEMLKIVNDSRYGLAATIFSADIATAQSLASKLDVGHVAINGLVKSDPRLPFGGVKKSGYGNELARHGLMEFVNAKTIWIA